MSTDRWPLFGLRITTPTLLLRPLADSDFDELDRLLAGGIHPPEVMPFTVPWTDAPLPELQQRARQHHWLLRATWEPDDWKLAFGAWEDGRLVGQQGIDATSFAVLREVSSGSWLGMAHQGRGIGREMRAAVLHFAFDTLGALRARTEAFADNAASLGVTRALGYAPNGDGYLVRRGAPARQLRFVLDREAWARERRDDIEVAGFDACRSMFGLPGDEARGDR